MELRFLGSGCAIPYPERVQSGILLKDDPLLFDCGSGVLHNLTRTSINFDDVGDVLLTHNHLDHVSDLLALIKADWLVGREELNVYGPPGTGDTVDGLFDAFEYLKDRV
ncbi:MAG: MBL fold metallo-hydrolase, partial [Halobacteria archaeon]|nr:MBL fold metallo-hydrolase [Halobacteria archaeon]